LIPVSDAVRSRTFPFVNIALILACIAVFIYELTLSDVRLQQLFIDHGAIPAEISDWAANPSGLREPATVFTSAFLHGGWLHLAGNMLFLWVFGDNVEDALGHIPYLLFYLLAAVAAVALEVFVQPNAVIPMVGASGAIAGVLGAYLVLYPRATVSVLVPIFFFIPFPIPAFVLIGFWFLLQLFSGIASIGGGAVAEQSVAFWAHVGGFTAGFAILLALRPFIRR
jgi:membrane associated rhomboid family serine protease